MISTQDYYNGHNHFPLMGHLLEELPWQMGQESPRREAQAQRPRLIVDALSPPTNTRGALDEDDLLRSAGGGGPARTAMKRVRIQDPAAEDGGCARRIPAKWRRTTRCRSWGWRFGGRLPSTGSTGGITLACRLMGFSNGFWRNTVGNEADISFHLLLGFFSF